MRICCDLTGSVLPARSTEKNFTVRVWLTLKALVYRVLAVVGVDPLVVEYVAATPDPPVPSVAASLTVTDAWYHPVEHVALLQVMVVVGAVPSIVIVCALTTSALPAVSTEKYFTVPLWVTLKAPVYFVLAVVGVD